MAPTFRQAVEAGDLDAVIAMCRDDVVFRSPVVFTPYEGKAALRQILTAVLEVFEGFHYVREIGAADASDHALVFRAKVGDKEIEGCDFLAFDENGAIKEFTVMVRPLSATLTLAEMMKARLTGG